MAEGASGAQFPVYGQTPYSGMTAEASGSARVYQAGRDQVIYEQNPPFYLSQVPLSAPVLETRRIRPSKMLRTNLEIVPFSGRESELAQLKKWRDTAVTSTAVQLIHGPGGQGKTRLVMQLARMWAAERWFPLQAFSLKDFKGLSAADITPEDPIDGVLIVVDYAERWETDDLLALLRRTEDRGGPVRIILLSRPAGTWWHALFYQIERCFDITVDQMYLSPLADSPADRLRLFEEARDVFGRRLGVQDPTYIRPPRDLEKSASYSQVLTIHMAALAAVVAFIEADYPPRDPAELSAFLLARERDHWLAMHSRRDDPVRTPPDVMGQMVYTAVLTGPLSYKDALSALKFAQVESSELPGQLIRDHARCYPRYEDDSVLEPLYPDRLGEDFIALTTPGHDYTSFPPDQWAKGALARLISRPKSPPWALSMETLLAEIGSRWPHMEALAEGGRMATGKHHRRLQASLD